MATNTWYAKTTNYAKGSNAWSGHQALGYLGNSYCMRLLMPTLKDVAVASVLNITFERVSGNGTFPIKFYVGNNSSILPSGIAANCTLIGEGSLATPAGQKTFSIKGSESKINIYTGDFYLYITSDGTYTTNTVAIRGGDTSTGRTAITGTYESSAIRVHIGTAGWKTGTVYVHTGTNGWKPGVAYVHTGTGGWKIGT